MPPGFILKKDKKKEEKKDEISIEELVERERAALGSNLTKVTLETMTAWKKRKLKEKRDQLLKDEEKKRNDFKAGRQVGVSLARSTPVPLFTQKCSNKSGQFIPAKLN